MYIAEIPRHKLILKARPATIFRREEEALDRLTKARFPHIPPYYGRFKLNGQDVLAQEYIEGSELLRDPGSAGTHLKKIARALRQLKDIRLTRKKSLAAMIGEEAKQLEQLWRCVNLSCEKKNNPLLKPFLRKALSCKEKMSFFQRQLSKTRESIFPSLINGEPEILISGKRVYILDWECARYADNVYDIAYLAYRYPDMEISNFLKLCYQGEHEKKHLKQRFLLWRYFIHMKNYLFSIQDFNCSSVYYKIPDKLFETLVKIDLEKRLDGLRRACAELEFFLSRR
ncbi:MAG: phosphotransferase [Candidatus Omnitrophota bacterium]